MEQAKSKKRPGILLWAGYLTILGVGLIVVFSTPSDKRLLCIGFLALFTLCLPPRIDRLKRSPLLLHSLTVFESGTVFALMLWGGSPVMAALLYFVLIPKVSRGLARGWAFFYGAMMTALAFGAIAARGILNQDVSVLSLLPGFFAIIAFSDTYNKVHIANEESRRLLENLIDAQVRLKNFAVAEERDRIAREMHDSVGHRLTVAAVQLEAVGKILDRDPTKAKHMVDNAKEQVRQGLGELRNAVSSIHSLRGHDRSLSQEVRESVRAFEMASGFQVELIWPDEADELGSPLADVIIKTVQEGLTNVQKYASGKLVIVSLVLDERFCHLHLINDVGSSTSIGWLDSGGRGLANLQKRAEEAGGEIHFEKSETKAELRLRLPLGERE